MVFPGIVRKINKNLPALLQTILVICLIHFVGQSVLLRVQKKLHVGRYAYLATTTHRPTHAHTGSSKVSRGVGGGGFSRSPRPSSSTTTTTTTTTTTPTPPLPDKLMEQEHQRRIDILRNTCTRWNMGLWAKGESANLTTEEKMMVGALPKSPLYQALIISEKKKIGVCLASRTGMQWVARRFLQLTGNYDAYRLSHLHEPPSAIARHAYAYLSSWEMYPIVLANSVTILMARHPLDRLLASYRQLLEDPKKNPNGYLHYGRRIVRLERKAPTHSKGPTFDEFVRYVLSHDAQHLEESWQPMTRKCTPCHIPYNIVTHYETLWHDIQWAWKKAGLGPLNTTDYVQNTLTPSIRREYFSQLTLAQVLQLYSKYKLDFQLYGYTLEEHMAYAKPGDDPIDPALMADIPKSSPDLLQDLLREAQEQAQLEGEADNVGNRKEASADDDSINVNKEESLIEVSNNLAEDGDSAFIPPRE